MIPRRTDIENPPHVTVGQDVSQPVEQLHRTARSIADGAKYACPRTNEATYPVAMIREKESDVSESNHHEVIVIGAGDAAIENAVALAKQNTVIIVNRKGEFARAKDGNLSLITDSLEKLVLSSMYSAPPVRVAPVSLTLTTPHGHSRTRDGIVSPAKGAERSVLISCVPSILPSRFDAIMTSRYTVLVTTLCT